MYSMQKHILLFLTHLIFEINEYTNYTGSIEYKNRTLIKIKVIDHNDNIIIEEIIDVMKNTYKKKYDKIADQLSNLLSSNLIN